MLITLTAGTDITIVATFTANRVHIAITTHARRAIHIARTRLATTITLFTGACIQDPIAANGCRAITVTNTALAATVANLSGARVEHTIAARRVGTVRIAGGGFSWVSESIAITILARVNGPIATKMGISGRGQAIGDFCHNKMLSVVTTIAGS